MSMAATAHAHAAKEHAIDAAAQLNDLHDRLSECISYLIGTNQDAVHFAGVHLTAIKEEVGSATAGQLASDFAALSAAIKSTPIGALVEAKEAIGSYLGRVDALRDRVQALAAQLGA